jgi:hypothetical protein
MAPTNQASLALLRAPAGAPHRPLPLRARNFPGTLQSSPRSSILHRYHRTLASIPTSRVPLRPPRHLQRLPGEHANILDIVDLTILLYTTLPLMTASSRRRTTSPVNLRRAPDDNAASIRFAPARRMQRTRALPGTL